MISTPIRMALYIQSKTVWSEVSMPVMTAANDAIHRKTGSINVDRTTPRLSITRPEMINFEVRIKVYPKLNNKPKNRARLSFSLKLYLTSARKAKSNRVSAIKLTTASKESHKIKGERNMEAGTQYDFC